MNPRYPDFFDAPAVPTDGWKISQKYRGRLTRIRFSTLRLSSRAVRWSRFLRSLVIPSDKSHEVNGRAAPGLSPGSFRKLLDQHQ